MSPEKPFEPLGSPCGGPDPHVRLVYHYSDGHDFTTDPMLRTEALAYMPVLHATRVDAEHYAASFALIELCDA